MPHKLLLLNNILNNENTQLFLASPYCYVCVYCPITRVMDMIFLASLPFHKQRNFSAWGLWRSQVWRALRFQKFSNVKNSVWKTSNIYSHIPATTNPLPVWFTIDLKLSIDRLLHRMVVVWPGIVVLLGVYDPWQYLIPEWSNTDYVRGQSGSQIKYIEWTKLSSWYMVMI